MGRLIMVTCLASCQEKERVDSGKDLKMLYVHWILEQYVQGAHDYKELKEGRIYPVGDLKGFFLISPLWGILRPFLLTPGVMSKCLLLIPTNWHFSNPSDLGKAVSRI